MARLERHRIDAECRQQAGRYRAIGARAVDLQGPSIDELDFAPELELVPLGVTAEIVMVVEHQDARACINSRTIEIGRRQPADPAAHDDQIVLLPGLDRTRPGFRIGAVTQRMGGLEAAGMAAAHPRQGRWVIAGLILRRWGGSLRIDGGQNAPRRSEGRADRDAVDEITPRDPAADAEAA